MLNCQSPKPFPVNNYRWQDFSSTVAFIHPHTLLFLQSNVHSTLTPVNIPGKCGGKRGKATSRDEVYAVLSNFMIFCYCSGWMECFSAGGALWDMAQSVLEVRGATINGFKLVVSVL